VLWFGVFTRDCNPRIPSRFRQHLSPGISRLQKLADIVLFCMLNDRNKNFSHLASARVILCAVAINLYFDSYCHSLQFRYTFRSGPMHKISQLGIPEWWPICKPNPETWSWDYKFWESNPKIAITTFHWLLYALGWVRGWKAFAPLHKVGITLFLVLTF